MCFLIVNLVDALYAGRMGKADYYYYIKQAEGGGVTIIYNLDSKQTEQQAQQNKWEVILYERLKSESNTHKQGKAKYANEYFCFKSKLKNSQIVFRF